MNARAPSPAPSAIRASACSTSSRLLVRPLSRSAASCATVHMEEDDSTLKNLAGLLFGGSCLLCRGAAREALCADCASELPRLRRPLCPRCALASPGGATCGRCLAEPPRYDATVAALAYAFPGDVLIQALKFRGELSLAPLLAGMLSRRIPADEAVDMVVPVPLSPWRLRERGYN